MWFCPFIKLAVLRELNERVIANALSEPGLVTICRHLVTNPFLTRTAFPGTNLPFVR
jgi:hypothetical protein